MDTGLPEGRRSGSPSDAPTGVITPEPPLKPMPMRVWGHGRQSDGSEARRRFRAAPAGASRGAARDGPVPAPLPPAAQDGAAGSPGGSGAVRDSVRATAERGRLAGGDLVSGGVPPRGRPPAPAVAGLGKGLLLSAGTAPGPPRRRLPRPDPRLPGLRRQRPRPGALRPRRGGRPRGPAATGGGPPPARVGSERRRHLGPPRPEPDGPGDRRDVRGRLPPSLRVVVARGPPRAAGLSLLPHRLPVRLPLPGRPPPCRRDGPPRGHLRQRRARPR